MSTRLPLAQRIIGLQVVIVLAASLAAVAATAFDARRQLDAQYEQRALAIAKSVAAMPAVQDAVVADRADPATQELAESVRHSTGASYIVITDRAGIRLTHPNPALIGRPVDENPADVLAGRDWVGIQTGTLGKAARGKAPIFRDGAVIGIVSVGYPDSTVGSQLLSYVPGYLVVLLVAIALGVGGSLLLARHVKREIFGLEPYEIAGLLEEREASLHGIREGALATATDGTITLANQEAQRLLGLGPDAVGRKLSQVVPPGRLLTFLAGDLRDEDELVLAGERVIAASRRPVRVRGREIGHVVTLRDAHDLSTLSDGIGVDSLTDALRAQAHEFSNRLHAIAGLFELGRGDEAMNLITETSGLQQELSEALLGRVGDPVLGALLLAKAAVASERGVDFHVSEATMLTEKLLGGDDLITLLGNLIDNAIDAAAQNGGRRRVDVSVVTEDEQVLMTVADSGPGVPDEARDEIFVEGFTTKRRPGRKQRGLGLALARQIANKHGGAITVRNQGGAVFSVRIPIPSPVRA